MKLYSNISGSSIFSGPDHLKHALIPTRTGHLGTFLAILGTLDDRGRSEHSMTGGIKVAE